MTGGVGERADSPGTGDRRRALVQELRALEGEWSRIRAGLAALGPGERLPGLYVVVGLPGGRMLLPCARVAEIARVVACEPIAGAPPWVLGAFVWRGSPAVHDYGPVTVPPDRVLTAREMEDLLDRSRGAVSGHLSPRVDAERGGLRPSVRVYVDEPIVSGDGRDRDQDVGNRARRCAAGRGRC